MTAPAPAPEFPPALADDHDDVAWALQTGVVQWNRGGYEDALVWLRRAVDAALQNGAYHRASELTRVTDALEEFVEDVPPQAAHDGLLDAGEIDVLIGDRASVPEVVIGKVEYATQSLVDAAELMGMDVPTDTDLQVPDAFEADEAPVESLDPEEIEVLDEEEFEELPEQRPSANALEERRPQMKSASPLEERRPEARPSPAANAAPPPRKPPPPSPARVLAAPPKSAGTPKRPAAQRTYPSPFDPAEPTQTEQEERRSSPAAQPYAAEGGDETTRPRSVAGVLAYAEEETPTGVRPFAGDILPESDPQASSAPPEASEDEIDVPVAATGEESSDEQATPLVAAAAANDATNETGAPAPGDDGEPALQGVKLADVRGLEDLPPETQAELVGRARIEVLGPDEEVNAFGLALVLKGSVSVMPAIADVACARASVGEPVFCQGNLENGVAVRVVAHSEGAELAVWQAEDFESAMASCPWVAEELRTVADRFQALAGATMGPLGDSLDESMRALVTDRTEVKRLEAGEELLSAGNPLPGLHIVGAGSLEIEGGDEALPGDLLFAQLLLGGGATPKTVRAGDQGALVLFVDRSSAHELMMSVPPLLEVLASA
jgi:CRP-like cAMP-binding protein